MSACFASTENNDANSGDQNYNANDLKGQVVIGKEQHADSVDVVGCRSWKRRESLFATGKATDYGKNLDREHERNRDPTGGCDPVDAPDFFGAQIEQHYDEEKQHHDCAGI